MKNRHPIITKKLRQKIRVLLKFLLTVQLRPLIFKYVLKNLKDFTSLYSSLKTFNFHKRAS